MEVFTYLFIILIVGGIIGLFYMLIFNNFQEFIIRMNEAESNIDSTLRKRFDLLNKVLSIIKQTGEKQTLNILEKLRSKKLTNFDLDRQLYDAINEYNIYKEENQSIKSNEEITRIDINLQESEAEIVAFRKYYNDIVTNYNKLIRTIPSNIIAKISNYKEKPYYDGKNMNDDVFDDFKL